jgi:hypothetical protein
MLGSDSPRCIKGDIPPDLQSFHHILVVGSKKISGKIALPDILDSLGMIQALAWLPVLIFGA